MRGAARRAAGPLAGPALVAGAVLLVLHRFVTGWVSTQHPDLLGYWLPTYCYLGRSLRQGRIPLWDPHVLAGTPFASNPQSGWLYLPAMVLFTALPCGRAIGWIVVLQPLIGGLGAYGFLRSERASRPAATVAGLSLALSLASSRLGLFLPFPSAIAWTMVVLATTSRFLRARSGSARLLWCGGAALAWGQLVGAHSTYGAVIGTGAVLALLAAGGVSAARSGRRSPAASLALGLLLGAAFVGINLAVLLPRLAYLPATSYGPALARKAQLAGAPVVDWPLKLGTSPGGYLGATALLASFAGFGSRRRRPLAVAFGAYGLACYLLGLRPLVGPLAERARGRPLLDFYAHFPGRLSLGLLVSLPVLAGLGVEAAREARSGRSRALMLLPGAVVWVVLPVLFGSGHRSVLPLAAAALGGTVLWLGARGGRLGAAVPIVLALELVAGALLGQGGGAGRAYLDDRFGTASNAWLVPMARPKVWAGDYLRPGPIADALRRADGASGRYLSLDPARADQRGYLTLQSPRFWGLMANGRAALFGAEDAQGYDPIQLLRYWRFVQAVAGRPLSYNTSVVLHPTPAVLDLLQVRFVITPRASPLPGGAPVAEEGQWTLWERPSAPPRATAFTDWSVALSPRAALREVTRPGFDPARRVVLEAGPQLSSPRPGAPAAAAYHQEGPQAAQVEVRSAAPAVVLVRTPFAPGWRATVDGHPAPVLAADSFLQGIPVPAGRHTVRLRYVEPWVGRGLVGSGVALALLLGAAAILARRGRRAETPAVAAALDAAGPWR